MVSHDLKPILNIDAPSPNGQFPDSSMADPSPHPTPAELNAYSLGHLPSDRAIAIDRHISECQPCCETIVGISSDDTFVGLLKAARQMQAEPDSDPGYAVRSSNSLSSPDLPFELAEHPRYEILGLIGRGGMGDVYQARHRKMERTVALKVINRRLAPKAEVADRFQREVKTVAQLSHPNIVTAHDADNAGDYHFMVMEYVDGIDLSRIIQDRGALPVAEACTYIHQAAVGLHYAHERGMVHRDIKPHNLMLTSEGTIKILDFGLASLAPELASTENSGEIDGEWTTAGVIMGTPDFISPEQAQDARLADVRSDIYSLGATLYHLLAGRPPFDGGSVAHKLKGHAEVEPDRLDSLRQDIPPQLGRIVARMMAKDPDERFQTAAEVAAALESCLPTDEPAPELAAHPIQSTRKRSRLLTLTAVATLFIAALVAGVVFYLQTGNGLIRVELMDESLEAAIRGEKITVADGDKQFQIGAGRQQLVIRQAGSDVEFVTDHFRIWRNDQVKFEVKLIAGEVVVSKDGKPFDRKQADWLPPRIGGEPTRDILESSPARGLIEPQKTYVLGTGRVVSFVPPDQQQSIKVPVRGTVHRIGKRYVEGAEVKRGDILVEIEPYRADQVARLTANAADLRTQLTSFESKVETNRQNIVAFEAAKVQALTAADESIEATRAKWKAKERLMTGCEAKAMQAKLNHERQQTLLDEGASTKQELEKTQRARDIATAELESAKLELAEALNEWKVKKEERVQKEREAESRINYAQALRQDAVNQAATLRNEIRAIEVKLTELLGRIRIKAPRDGALFRVKLLERSQLLKEGEELFTIVPEKTGRAVELWISGKYAPFVQPGDPVPLQFEGWPVVDSAGSFAGEVATVDPTADGAGRFRILVKPGGNDSWPSERYLRPGVRAKGWIPRRSPSNPPPGGN